jgi:hypothetical protein
MAVMLDRWNDDKMDGLAGKVDGLERRMERIEDDLSEHRRETKAGFESLHRTLVHVAVALSSSFIIGFAALVGLIATQM